jgi:hypothetical protein
MVLTVSFELSPVEVGPSQVAALPTPAILLHTIDRNDFAEHQKDCGISQHSHFLTKRACHDEIAAGSPLAEFNLGDW